MNPNDQHYTPASLANRLARLLPKGAGRVVDLAAGAGSLLEAVERRTGGKAQLVGADIDRNAVELLRRKEPRWVVSHANSLDPSSYRASAAFRLAPAAFDAAILNPPFSYRGGTRTTVHYRGGSYSVTPATAFLAHAHAWLRSGGMIVAIVPENLMNIRGDASLWHEWSTHFAVEQVELLDRNTFPKARTTAMIVRLDLGAAAIRDLKALSSRRRRDPVPWAGLCTCVQVVRGRVPVHQVAEMADGTGASFVHTTHIRNGSLASPVHRISDAFASSGPFVLLPRVGTPNGHKIAIAEVGRLVLSDCVFGLRPGDPSALRSLHALITDNFSELSRQYVGSCARYLTVGRLLEWLRSYGLNARHVGAAEVCNCQCSSSPANALA